MSDAYSWSESRDTGTHRLPGPEHLGWWAAAAMLVSILFHVGVFIALDRINIGLHFQKARELSTRPVDVRRVEVRPSDPDNETPPEPLITPPLNPASMLEEVDLLNALPKDKEIDIKPEIQQAEYDLQMKNPALAGDPKALAKEAAAGMEIDAADLPELGRNPERLKPAEMGQVTVDPGAVQADDSELGKFTENLLKRGANGKVDKGTLDGVASLDDLLDLPPNVLLGKKTMLPSDLLFEFNRAELRESAKVGLMKLALLMDRNPSLYCWIEGHTDLVGGDEFNLKLSVRRAEAVKNYLATSLRMDAAKISTRGFGRFHPLVTRGSTEEQAIHRRVELRMRKPPPTDEPLEITSQKAVAVEDSPPPAKAVVADDPPPAKAVVVEDSPAKAIVEEPPPPAKVVVEEPPPPKTAGKTPTPAKSTTKTTPPAKPTGKSTGKSTGKTAAKTPAKSTPSAKSATKPPTPQKAISVKPKHALPVDEGEPAPPRRALPVSEPESAPKATPPKAPRALPVEG